MTCSIGLALGSGAARGWAHIGVVRVLADAGIVPDFVCGTSIGAVVGALNVTGDLTRLERWARHLTKTRVGRLFDFQFGHGGLIGGQRLLRALEPRLGGKLIEQLPRRFACVATDIDTGHEIWIREGTLIDAVRASYSVPGIFPAVRLGGRCLVDGALVNPIPISLCRALGAQVVIASDVNADVMGHGPAHTERVELSPRLEADQTERRFLHGYFTHRHDIPSAFTALTRSLHIIQDHIGRMRLAQDPPDVHILPNVARVGPVEFHRADECISAGEAAAVQALPAIHEAIRTFEAGEQREKRQPTDLSAAG
jgi:NTE family protein